MQPCRLGKSFIQPQFKATFEALILIRLDSQSHQLSSTVEKNVSMSKAFQFFFAPDLLKTIGKVEKWIFVNVSHF